MKKRIALFIATLILSSGQGTMTKAADESSLSAIADSLGAKTDLLNIPNYYHDEERPIPEASYKEWLSKATNVEYALNSLQTFNSAAAKGNCLGITMIEVLCHNGVISPSDVQPNAETLSDVVYDDDINKLLTDYQALQVHTEYELFDHYLITALTYDEQVDRTLRIADLYWKCKFVITARKNWASVLDSTNPQSIMIFSLLGINTKSLVVPQLCSFVPSSCLTENAVCTHSKIFAQKTRRLP